MAADEATDADAAMAADEATATAAAGAAGVAMDAGAAMAAADAQPRRPYVVLVAGGIASGKSTVAREFERLGARRIDLDQLSRDVLAPATPTTRRVAEAFGQDLVDPASGELDRRLLAVRAFATEEASALLEAIELPAIRGRLREELGRELAARTACCVVEVPLLDRLGDPHAFADEVVAVVCPFALRRERAVRRGMRTADFERRAARQPSDDWLRAHADTVFCNDGDTAALGAFARAWWDVRFASVAK